MRQISKTWHSHHGFFAASHRAWMTYQWVDHPPLRPRLISVPDRGDLFKAAGQDIVRIMIQPSMDWFTLW